jgi:hypothetical protein
MFCHVVLVSYRKLKRDLQSELTETSISGAALSIVATIVMFGLVVAEFNSYLTTTVGEGFACTVLTDCIENFKSWHRVEGCSRSSGIYE